MLVKPGFNTLWNNFSDVNISVKGVGSVIGGKVKTNIDNDIFQNACAIRMSYALNHAGVFIPAGSKWKTSSGADGKDIFIGSGT